MRLLFTFLIFCAYCQDFFHVFSNTQPTAEIRSLDISDDNQVLVAGCYNSRAYVLRNSPQGFFVSQVMPESRGDVEAVDITGDGEWILVVDYRGRGIVYNLNNETYFFQKFGTVDPIDGLFYSYAGAITDDHLNVIIGMYNGNIHIYFMFNDTYYHIQNLTQSESTISHISITKDKLFIAASNMNSEVFIYKHNGWSYELFQNITVQNSSSPSKVFITDDYQYLTFSIWDDQITYIYKYNPFSQTYEQFSSLPESSRTYYSSIYDKQIAVSTQGYTRLYKITNQSKVQEKGYLNLGYFHRFSNDGHSLFSGGPSNIDIFERCDSGKYYSEITGKCQFCGEGCEKCLNLYACWKCSENSSYYFKNYQCSYCNQSDNFYISFGQCLYCNESQSYLLFQGQCEYCGIQGCTHCDNMTCLQCSSDYFMQNETCLLCEVQGCIQCTNKEECSFCNTSNNYFLNNKTCEQCTLDGCVTCESLTSCTTCLDEYFFFKGICRKCELLHCSRCLSMQQCGQCESSYKLEKGICSIPEQFPFYVIGIIVGGILIVVIILIVVLRKRRGQAYEENVNNGNNAQSLKTEKKLNKSETSGTKLIDSKRKQNIDNME